MIPYDPVYTRSITLTVTAKPCPLIHFTQVGCIHGNARSHSAVGLHAAESRLLATGATSLYFNYRAEIGTNRQSLSNPAPVDFDRVPVAESLVAKSPI